MAAVQPSPSSRPTTRTWRSARPEPGWLGWRHRAASLLLGIGLGVFGVLGFVRQPVFFATSGPPILGLSTNGLLSTLSLVFGAILVGSAIRGGRTASTTSVVVGALFMASGVVNVLVLATPYNLLSFRMPNVIFSLVAGALLVVLGAYGRFTGRLPDDNPYQEDHASGPVDAEHGTDNSQQLPTDRSEAAAAQALAEAERQAAAGAPDHDRQRILAEVDTARDGARRRAIWRRHTS